MISVKKIIFAPIFLLALVYSLYLLEPIFKSTDLIFSLSSDTFLQILILCVFLLLVSLFYVLFVTFSQDWKMVLPVLLAAAVLPIALLPAPLSYVMTVGLVLSFLLETALLLNKLETYLTFSATTLLSPSIKGLATLLILVVSIGYFLSMSSVISQKGFQIPDSLLDFALKFVTPGGMDLNTNVKGVKYIAQAPPSIPPQMIEYIKQHPELVKQAGYDPAVLEQIPSPSSKPADKNQTTPGQENSAQSPFQSAVKDLIKSQVQSAIKPIEKVIPLILGVLMFFILQPIAALLSLLISPLLWLIFYTFEKTNFIHFEKEMREVRKLVV